MPDEADVPDQNEVIDREELLKQERKRALKAQKKQIVRKRNYLLRSLWLFILALLMNIFISWPPLKSVTTLVMYVTFFLTIFILLPKMLWQGHKYQQLKTQPYPPDLQVDNDDQPEEQEEDEDSELEPATP